MQAVRHLVEGGRTSGSNDDALAEARAFGMPASEIAKLENRAAAREPEGLWPQNVPAIRALDAAFSQWRTALVVTAGGLASRITGLDYAAANVAWLALGIALTADEFSVLQSAEGFAVTLLNGGNPA